MDSSPLPTSKPNTVVHFTQSLILIFTFNGDINSFMGKANYFGTHVVRNKLSALQENVVSKLTLT